MTPTRSATLGWQVRARSGKTPWATRARGAAQTAATKRPVSWRARSRAPEFVSAANDLHFVVLAIALEEDGGRDVRRLYGALEHPHELSVFSHVAREVTPVSLGEVRTASWPVDQPTSVELLVDGSPSRCKDDSLVGAVVLHLSARETSATSLYRMPFRTADRKNDWTVFLHVTH